MKLLFIIGMQKSGTSLFNRMLMQQSVINNPFLPEGKFFWGDNPPFSPVEKPCGELFQKYNGLRGHYLDENDATENDRSLLMSRIKEVNIKESILMNKNPYNTVRIKWLRNIFPEAKIIAIYRNPIANVYSLLKRYIIQDNQGLPPENGWWGIKPENWQKMTSVDKLVQCANQWNAVNQQILLNNDCLDMMVDYKDLCKNPKKIITQAIYGLGVDEAIKGCLNITNIKNMNNEYLTGSRLLSKNKELRRGNDFDLSNLHEAVEFPPLQDIQTQEIQNICDETWVQLKTAHANKVLPE